MHSHDKTMLAKFGFADPDRKEPSHDLACRYLATKEVSEKIIKNFGTSLYTEKPMSCEANMLFNPIYCRQSFGFRVKKVLWLEDLEIEKINPKLEFEISKGEGKYKTTVGFCDLVLSVGYKRLFHNVSLLGEDGNYTGLEENEKHKVTNLLITWKREEIFVEVKTREISIGDILRQINLYRSYCQSGKWILATTYKLKTSHSECLKKEGVQHVFLGEKFHEWVKQQLNDEVSKSLEL